MHDGIAVPHSILTEDITKKAAQDIYYKSVDACTDTSCKVALPEKPL